MTVYKGVRYFPTYEEARTYAEASGAQGYRIVAYGRGYAIQIRVSGPYL
jgi:hypothetical protein